MIRNFGKNFEYIKTKHNKPKDAQFLRGVNTSSVQIQKFRHSLRSKQKQQQKNTLLALL